MRALVFLTIFFSSMLIATPTVALANSPADSFWCQWFGWVLPACTVVSEPTVVPPAPVVTESAPTPTTHTTTPIPSPAEPVITYATTTQQITNEYITIERTGVSGAILNERISQLLLYIDSLLVGSGETAPVVTSDTDFVTRDYVLKSLDRVYDTRSSDDDSNDTSTLTVATDLRLVGALFDATNSTGSSGMVLQSTGTSTQWVATSSLGISGGGGSGSSLFTDGGATTYLTSLGDNVAIGTTTANAKLTIQNDSTIPIPGLSVGDDYNQANPDADGYLSLSYLAQNSQAAFFTKDQAKLALTAGVELQNSSNELLNVGVVAGGFTVNDLRASGTVSSIAGVSSLLQLTSDGSVTNASAYRSNVNVFSNNVDSLYGLNNRMFLAFNNTDSRVYGVANNFTSFGVPAVLGDVYGYHTQLDDTINSVENFYGLYVSTSSVTVNQDYFGVYIAEPTANNYFAGNVGIGTTTPNAKLTVAGNINIAQTFQPSPHTSSEPFVFSGQLAAAADQNNVLTSFTNTGSTTCVSDNYCNESHIALLTQMTGGATDDYHRRYIKFGGVNDTGGRTWDWYTGANASHQFILYDALDASHRARYTSGGDTLFNAADGANRIIINRELGGEQYGTDGLTVYDGTTNILFDIDGTGIASIGGNNVAGRGLTISNQFTALRGQNDENVNVELVRTSGTMTSGNIIGQFQFRGTAGGEKIGGCISATAGGSWTAGDAPTRMEFSTRNVGDGGCVERMRIDPIGRVGIGTTSPQSLLTVAGVITPDANNSYSLGNSTYRWSEVFASNGVINTSDERLKENIATSTYGLTQLLALSPVSFTWIDNPEQGTKLGLLAQDVQLVLPEIVQVGDDENKTLGVRYTEIIPVIINSIKELWEVVTGNQEDIEALQERIQILEQRLDIEQSDTSTSGTQPDLNPIDTAESSSPSESEVDVIVNETESEVDAIEEPIEPSTGDAEVPAVDNSLVEESVDSDPTESVPTENSEEEVIGVVAEPVEETPESESVVEEEIEEVVEVEAVDAPASVEETT